MDKEELMKLVNRVHDNAVRHGWHEEKLSADHWLMMIITEVCEMIEADRKGKHANKEWFIQRMKESGADDKDFIYTFKASIKDSVEDELSDICIRIKDMAGELYTADDFVVKLVVFDCNMKSDKAIKEALEGKTLTEISMLAVRQLVSEKREPLDNIAITFQCLYSIARIHGIDLDWHIKQKMHYNELRPYHHGGKKY